MLQILFTEDGHQRAVMNKARLEYLFEREHIKNDNLSDVLGQQSQHISELWNEIGQKALRINYR